MSKERIDAKIEELRDATEKWINVGCPCNEAINNIITREQFIEYFVDFSKYSIKRFISNWDSLQEREVNCLFEDFERRRSWRE